jgi:hypothetical protein
VFLSGQNPASEVSAGTALGLKTTVISEYAGGTNWTTYSPQTLPAGTRLLLRVGSLTTAQAVTMATALVNAGQGNAIIVPQWEANESGSCWFPWGTSCSGGFGYTSASYIAHYQTVVTGFRSVAGGSFDFSWNSNGGSPTAYPSDYPGSAYVNDIGVDQYNYGSYWSSQVQTVIGWAQANGKTFSILECGVYGNDSTGPGYIAGLGSIVNNPANHVLVFSYFDMGTSSLGGGSNPNSTAAFVKQAF